MERSVVPDYGLAERGHESQMGLAALSYRRRGWPVFPVGTDKKPLVRWAPFQKELPSEEDVTKWWMHNPTANIGLACGPASGIVVLDLDSEEGTRLLSARHLFLPETRCVKTGRGHHFYFEDPGIRTRNFANGKASFPLPHIDFRGQGGYVVIPPSVHENGRFYEWKNEGPIAPLPQWLFELVAESDHQRISSAAFAIRPGGDDLFHRLLRLACERAASGARNDAGLWLACQLRDNGCSQSEAEHYLLRFASAVRPNGNHPYTEREALETVRSAFSRGPREPWSRSVNGHSLSIGTPASTLQTIEAWPVLAPEAYATLPGEFVKAVEPYSEADPVALLTNVLTAFGCLIGSGPHFLIEHQPHPPRLNALIVGRSSNARKGTSWSTPRYVLSRIDQTWVESRVKSGLSSGEGLIYPVRDADGDDPGEEDKRLLIIESEFASTLKVMEREGNTLSAKVRDAWDHGILTPMTKRERIATTRAHISIIGHITQDELLRSLTVTERANGFANRFLFILARRSKFLPSGKGAPLSVLEPYLMRFLRTVDAARTRGEVRRDPEAEELWTAMYPKLEEEVPGLTGAILARGAAQVLRLSLIYSLLDEEERRQADPAIRVNHLMAGLAVWDYCKSSVLQIFGDAVGDPTADKLLRLIKAGPKSDTDLYMALGKHSQDQYRKDLALDLLLRLSRVHCAMESTAGRPVRWWHVGTLETCALCAKRV